ncbi:MAG: anthranilate/aminodeoxychorismate synthase component II [Zetaproteobacteria bacterium CG12_big_fil_rev_8_21_14_0_65_55_1124]|nr:MAG: anthranilate/aminodeoxychorismate synthase component II [Zetaproteobacteria bacterium CG1_02_55_237]PIS19578.1 MAG: anthranilate/aminodeoxychorismate synthase component II [Zetaproteobacteria bacterium CG08_land_8_20_14_0_20_55_17]PIW42661.1 MAG: anthranilate/aminodeoxychorismate synthase component II [Zetaproteobacteria bacterium CG12_big_fil_rev_8_21_14_0_65_55_1124]PIY52028.1 MAG: anthranilate/aminodeoxychorismate synthase component II [Zetaproteobacteria bacterium CG_4_10_14_0_8_um_f
MMLVIDNYDSFTFNLVQYLGELGQSPEVHRNDRISTDDIAAMQPSHILISPGPCTPLEAGISVDTIRRFSGYIPILGVCLGHQSIGEAFGGKVVRAPRLMHGKTSPILHDGSGIFAGIPSPFTATRYHSLIVEGPLPSVLRRTAWTAEGELMGLAHIEHPTFGVQFHPESILTEHGHTMLQNFLNSSI